MYLRKCHLLHNLYVIVLNKIIVVIKVISDVIERDLFNPINLLNEPGLIFYVVLKSQHWCRDQGSCRELSQPNLLSIAIMASLLVLIILPVIR